MYIEPCSFFDVPYTYNLSHSLPLSISLLHVIWNLTSAFNIYVFNATYEKSLHLLFACISSRPDFFLSKSISFFELIYIFLAEPSNASEVPFISDVPRSFSPCHLCLIFFLLILHLWKLALRFIFGKVLYFSQLKV